MSYLYILVAGGLVYWMVCDSVLYFFYGSQTHAGEVDHDVM